MPSCSMLTYLSPQKHGSNSEEMHLICTSASEDSILPPLLPESVPYREQWLRLMTMGFCIGNTMSWNRSETHQRSGVFGPCSAIGQVNSF